MAEWDVSLSDGNHKVQFEHGTTSGKRVIRVDGRVSVIAFLKLFKILYEKKIL